MLFLLIDVKFIRDSFSQDANRAGYTLYWCISEWLHIDKCLITINSLH